MVENPALERALAELRETVTDAAKFELEDFRRLILACHRTVDCFPNYVRRELESRVCEWSTQLVEFTDLSRLAFDEFSRIFAPHDAIGPSTWLFPIDNGNVKLCMGWMPCLLRELAAGDVNAIIYGRRLHAELTNLSHPLGLDTIGGVASLSDQQCDYLTRWFEELPKFVLRQERDLMIACSFLQQAHQVCAEPLQIDGFDSLKYKFWLLWGDYSDALGQDVVTAAEVLSATSDQSHGDSHLRSDGNTSAGAIAHTQDRPAGASQSEPLREAIIAYHLKYRLGIKTQREIAEIMTKDGIPAVQGQVSRWLKQVRDYREAGGYISDPESNGRCETPMDPHDLEIGPRIDSRASRQRSRRNDG